MFWPQFRRCGHTLAVPHKWAVKGWLRNAIVAIACVSATAGTATASTLTAPGSAPAGSRISVGWDGQSAPTDFISVDRPGDPDRTYGPYGYPAKGNPVEITVPDAPGTYVIRYHLAETYEVTASTPLEITAVTATLQAPATVDAGGDVSIRWTGPNNPSDFISIDRQGAPDREYGPYAYPPSGNPVTIRAPDEPGEYEIRYHQAGSYGVIGSTPLRIGSVAASLTAPDSVVAGAATAVQWTGPNDPQDFVSIDPVNAPDRTYGNYAYTQSGSTVSVRAPDQPGEYALRYHTGQTYKVLTSRAIRVDPATASLSAPANATAGHAFEVSWQGPNNEGDFITLLLPTAGEHEYGPSNGYTMRGNPVRMQAAKKPGAYELRYLTGQSYNILARAPITIVPDTTVAQLRVVATPDASKAPGFAAVELVLDASGSMLKRLGNARRIDLAKSALVSLTREIPAGSGFALRVFGHKEADSCRTDLEIPLGPLDVAGATARIGTIQSMNLAKTPLGDSLLAVKNDLAGASGAAVVVLVTDGEETCNGDPAAAIATLRSSGLDVRIHIVGFAVDELGLKETFQAWAAAGGGRYFDAQSGEELTAAVKAALRSTFEVRDGEKVVATGTVGADPIALPPGTYDVRVVGAPGREARDVVVEPGTTRDLVL